MLPSMIALCGHPTSGKTKAAEILGMLYGYELVDDGRPLREMAMRYLGLTHDQVHTQAGKLETVELNGRTWTVREILGEIGNAFEEKFGADILPMMSHQLLEDGKRYVFGSVRRQQGNYWRKHGALVLEIVNPDVGPSPYEFDRFDASACHRQVINDGLSKGYSLPAAASDLAGKLTDAVRAGL